MQPDHARALHARLAADPLFRATEVILVARRTYATATGDPVSRQWAVVIREHRASAMIWRTFIEQLPAGVDVALTDDATLTIY